MNWNHLTSLNQLDNLIQESAEKPILIFKHSRSCSISGAALNRLERNWNLGENVKVYFLDLLTYRDISNAIAERFEVEHESPQVLIIENQKSVYDSSHFNINFNDIRKKLQLIEG